MDRIASQPRQGISLNSIFSSFLRNSCVELRQNTSGTPFLFACCFKAFDTLWLT
jgi:hypothetical protein